MIINSLKKIYFVGITIRIILLIIGILMDNYFHITYTDIDYKVFSDGAKYITQGQSPFNRHTYRYSPLMAYFVIPNHYISPYYGKIMFILFDILAAVLIQSLLGNIKQKEKINMLKIWFLNPLTIQLSTRGSSDIIITVLILTTLYFLKQNTLKGQIISAIFYGLTVHFKIYPIIYCFVFYLYVKQDQNFINFRSILYGLISGGVFIGVTAFFYLLYGYEYLYEGYLYHVIRKDHRHNFSIQFLFIYLSFENINKILSFMLFLPQIILIVFATIKLHKNLYLSLFILSYIFVAFNKVMTAQYFVWFVQFLPLFFHQTSIYQQEKIFKFILMSAIWFGLILIWNNLAFRFETLGQDMFVLFHIINTSFFICNIWIMGEMMNLDKKQIQDKINSKKVKKN